MTPFEAIEGTNRRRWVPPEEDADMRDGAAETRTNPPPTTDPPTRRTAKTDPEMAAMRRIERVLAGLMPKARLRVLDYLRSRLADAEGLGAGPQG